jgi:CubicO group peptidase (beta-lactamase class C family)
VILSRGYGFANVEHRVPATDSTVYMVGSLTKPFTAATIVLLSQQRRLGLDDPIIKYLPEGRAVWLGVTIRHLLTHTAGVPQDTLLDWSREYSESEMVRSAAQPLQFKPGVLESYSSTGYALLGVIIHRVSGVPWDDYVREHIFRPLEMRTAGVNPEVERLPGRSLGYQLVNDTLKQDQIPVSRSINSMADCCLSFSTRDLVEWARGLNHAKVLGGAGLGWNLLEQRGYRRIGHSGAWRGSHATFQRYSDFDLTVIVLLNLDRANSEGIAVGIAGIVEPALRAPHHAQIGSKGGSPPMPIDRFLRAIADGRDSALVTPEFTATFPAARRRIIASFLGLIETWSFLGCDMVRSRGITRLRSRIERICYAKGTGQGRSWLFTVPYDRGWRAVGLDNVFGI